MMHRLYIRLVVGFIMSIQSCFVTSLLFASYENPCRKARAVKKMVVCVPVANLMSRAERRNGSYQKCTYQATQLLFGEQVVAEEERNGWIRVKALEQEGLRLGTWINCSGWVEKNQVVEVHTFPHQNLMVISHTAPLHCFGGKCDLMLSLGTKLVGKKLVGDTWLIQLPDGRMGNIAKAHVEIRNQAEEKDIMLVRNEALARVMLFVGDPYLWAGRSAYHMDGIRGADCSGVVNLVYSSLDIMVPRCSHDQYQKSHKLEKIGKDNVADLVFLFREETPLSDIFADRISHVMVYLGNDRLFEAEGDGAGNARVVLGRQRFGKAIEEIRSGDVVWEFKRLVESPLGHSRVLAVSPTGKSKIVFGSYLVNKGKNT